MNDSKPNTFFIKMSDEIPPFSRSEATDSLNQAFYLIEEHVSSSILTEKERKSLRKTQNSMQEIASNILSSLPSKRNNHVFDGEQFSSSRSSFTSQWERFKEKIMFLISKDPIQMCDDIIPYEHERICTHVNSIISLDIQSQQKQIFEIKEKLSNSITLFEKDLQLFLRQIHKKKEDKEECKKVFIKSIKKLRQEIASEYTLLFRVASLSNENPLNDILHSLDNIQEVSNRVSVAPSVTMPKNIRKADRVLRHLLSDDHENLSYSEDEDAKRATITAPLSLELTPNKNDDMKNASKKIRQSLSIQMQKNAKFFNSPPPEMKREKSIRSVSSATTIGDEEERQKRIEEIEEEIQRIEEENIKLQHELNVLQTNQNSDDSLDSRIEAYLRSKIAALDKEIESMQDKNRQITNQIAENTISFNEASERFRERELKAQEQSRIIEDSNIIQQSTAFEDERDGLLRMKEDMKNKAIYIENNIKQLQEKRQIVDNAEMALHDEIKALKKEGRKLQDEAMKAEETLNISREMLENNPLLDILDQIEKERQEVIGLERKKKTLDDDEIPDLLASIKIASSELSRVSDSLTEMQENYNKQKIEFLRQQVANALFA